MDRKECLQVIQSCKTLSMAKDAHAHIRRILRPDDVIMSNKLIEMYGKCGSVRHAREIFDGMSRKDSFSWGFMLCAYSRNGHLEEAKLIFNEMPKRDVVSWTAMLAAYAQHGHLEDAKRIFDEMPQRDGVSWSAMLAAYAQNGKLDEAKHIFDEMPQQNLTAWNAVLSAYAQKGHLEEAKHMFKQMPQRDQISWNAMLSAYVQNGHLEEAKNIFDEMPQRDLVSSTAMQVAYAQNGHVEEAKQMFDVMPQRDLVSWTAMLAAYAHNAHLKEAKALFEKMPQRDLVSWTAMLAGYAQNGHLEEAKHMFDGMPQQNLFTRNAMLSAYAQNGHLEEAKQTFSEMPQVDLVTWNAILSANAQNGQLEEAKRAFDEMPQRDLVSWNAMLSAYAQNGHLEEAKYIFDEMPFRDMVSWTAILDAYARNGYLEEARHLFEGMAEQNLVTWNAMLAAYAKNGHLVWARQLFDRMPEQDIISWSSMLAAYAHNGHSSDAFNMFDILKMIEMPDETCFIAVLIACSHAGEVHAGRCYFASMILDYGIEPSKQHYCCMIDVLGRAGYLDNAKDLLLNMPFRPDALEWTCFLAACNSHNDAEHGTRAAKSVLDLDSKDGAAYVLLANMYSTNGKNVDVLKVPVALGCSSSQAMYSSTVTASDYVCISGQDGWKSSMAGKLFRGTDMGAARKKAKPQIVCSSGCSWNQQATFGLVRSGLVHVGQKRDVSVGAGRRKKHSPGGRIEKRVPWVETLEGPSQDEIDKAIAEADIVYNDDYYKYGPYGPYAWKGLISGKPRMGDFTTHDGVVLYSNVRDEDENEERDKHQQCLIYGKKLDMMDEKVGIKYFFVFVRSTRRNRSRWQVPWKEWTLAAQVAVESGEKIDKWEIGKQVDLRARHGVTRCVGWCRPDLVYVKRPQYQMRYEPQEEFIIGLLELLNPETEMKGIVGTDLEEMKKRTYYCKLCEKLGVQQNASEDEILAAFANLDETRRLVVVEYMLCTDRVQLLHPFSRSWRDKERMEAEAAAEGKEIDYDGGNAEQEQVDDDEMDYDVDEQEQVDEDDDDEVDEDDDEVDEDDDEVDEDDDEVEDDDEIEEDEVEDEETEDGDNNDDEVDKQEKELNESDQGEKTSNSDARIETEGFRKRRKRDDYFGGKGNPLRRPGLTSWQRDYWKDVLPSRSAMKRIPSVLYFHHFDQLDNNDDETENWNFEPGTGLKAAVRPFTYTDMLQEIVFIRRQYACYR